MLDPTLMEVPHDNRRIARQAGAPGRPDLGAAGAVVSKTLIEQPAGTVTLFAFDKGQRLSEHTAPFDALVTALEGRVDIVLNGVRHPLAAGDAIIMPAGVTHAVDAVEACIWLLTMTDPDAP